MNYKEYILDSGLFIAVLHFGPKGKIATDFKENDLNKEPPENAEILDFKNKATELRQNLIPVLYNWIRCDPEKMERIALFFPPK